ncbi:MAG: SHOCT domain-containing protein [Candidatus Dormibacteria bacterium]
MDERPLAESEQPSRELITTYVHGEVWIEGREVVWTTQKGELRLPLAEAHLFRTLGTWNLSKRGAFASTNLQKATNPGAVAQLAERLKRQREEAKSRAREVLDRSKEQHKAALRDAKDAAQSAARAAQSAAREARAKDAQTKAAAEAMLPKTQVVRYKSVKEYEKDAQGRIAEGWTIVAQSQETGQTHRVRRAGSGLVTGALLGFPAAGAALGGLSGKRDEGPLTVTWYWPGSADVAKANTAGPASSDVPDQLRELANLRDAGILTAEEFQSKKTDLLSRM